MTRSLCATAAFSLGLLLGCTSDDRPAAPVGPRFQLDQAGSVSGNLLGANGTSICRALPEGATPVVRIFTTPPAPPGFIASQSVACPESTFSIALDPGTYFLRVTLLPVDPSIGNLPLRTIVTNPIAVSSGDVRQDIYIVPGSGLGGGATFDGVPLAGIGLSVQYDLTPGFEAAFGTSSADGGWVDDLGREPMLLQSGVRYRVSAAEVAYSPCEALGASTLQRPPTSVFLFPNELGAVNCGFTTAPAVTFSHNRTRLVVTPLPGDVGGLSPELSDQFGIGWGVQFPVATGQSAIHGARAQSQLYLGGLMVGIRPNRVLSGINVSSLEDCGSTCRDFGVGAKMSFVASPRFGKKVTWRYSDATSPEGVGLKVLQKSYDGVPPNDYVLFHFVFTNAGASAVTFYAGMYADWDIDGDGGNNVGATEMNGRLMYITDATPGGVYAGTLLLGSAPASGNMFQTGAPQLSAADVVAALAGDVRAPTASDPGDQNYLHSLGPITLKRDKSADIWIAIVAGETHDQLLANAAAAAADVARRGDDTNDDSDGTDGFAVSNALGGYIQPLKPRCKRSCVRWMRRLFILAAGVGAMCTAELGAQTALTPQAPPELRAPHGTHTCFRSRPLPACDAFWLTEFGIGLRTASAPSPYPSGTLFTWDLGWMKNRSPRSAVGATVFLGVPDQGGGGAAIGIRPRLRRWLSATTSVDMAPGLVLLHPGSVNYAPAFSGHVGLNLSDWFAVTTHVEVGSQLDSTATVSRTSVAWFAGGRLGSLPGAVSAVAAPLAVVIKFLIECSGGHCFE